MEIILSGEFGRVFFAVGTILVTWIVWNGYYKNQFSARFAWGTTILFIIYASAFLLFNYLTGEVDEHANTERWYALIASIHGTIALAAIIHACIAFYKAKDAFARGENYFRDHKKMSISLVLLWPLSLLSGLFL